MKERFKAAYCVAFFIPLIQRIPIHLNQRLQAAYLVLKQSHCCVIALILQIS